LALASGRSEANISQIRNGAVSPSIADFQDLIRVCDHLKPGFSDDFYTSLSSNGLSPEKLVQQLDSSQLAALMFAIGQRIQTYGPQQLLEVS